MSPLDVEVLMHHYCSHAPFPRLDAPACRDSLNYMFEVGALDYEGGNVDKVRVTELGLAWISAILSTEIPRIVYMDKNGNEIELRNA